MRLIQKVAKRKQNRQTRNHSRSKLYLSAHGRVDRLIGRICTTKTKVGGDRRQNRRRTPNAKTVSESSRFRERLEEN